MRVLMVAQAIDPEGDVRAFILNWVHALALKVEALKVLTLEQRPATLPSNVQVFSLGKERGNSRTRLLLNYYRHLFRLLPQVDIVFVHMSPRLAWLAWPVCLLLGRKVVLWFVHPKKSCELRLALWSSARVFTVSANSFAIPSPKVRAIGHGIALENYLPQTGATEVLKEQDLIVCVGRLMPIKDQLTLVRALQLLPGLRLALVGGVPAGVDAGYEAQLRRTVSELGLDNRVSFLGNQSASEIAKWFKRAALSVNLTQTGSFDKVVIESFAAGLPCLVRSGSFIDLLGEQASMLLLSPSSGPVEVAAAIKRYLALSAEEKQQLSQTLKERVFKQYDLDHLVSRIVRELQELVGG